MADGEPEDEEQALEDGEGEEEEGMAHPQPTEPEEQELADPRALSAPHTQGLKRNSASPAHRALIPQSGNLPRSSRTRLLPPALPTSRLKSSPWPISTMRSTSLAISASTSTSGSACVEAMRSLPCLSSRLRAASVTLLSLASLQGP